MSTYSPLERKLSEDRLPAVVMTFADIEQVLGRKLPKSAYNERIKRQWWANTDSHSQARAWLRAGRKAKLDVAANCVTFVRLTELAGRTAAVDPLGLSHAGRDLVDRMASQHGVDPTTAAAMVVNEAARSRRRAILTEMDGIRARSIHSDVSSADLIRQDRDAH